MLCTLLRRRKRIWTQSKETPGYKGKHYHYLQKRGGVARGFLSLFIIVSLKIPKATLVQLISQYMVLLSLEFEKILFIGVQYTFG